MRPADMIVTGSSVSRTRMPASRAEAGNVSYGLYASADAPERVAFLEEWKDEAAVETHNATPHFTEICPALGAFLKEPMQVTTYTQVL